MSVFGKYASFYDCLYQDKNYEAECDFLELILNRYTANTTKTMLDLGCGTGGHAIILTRRGYSVLGVDRSTEMLKLAKQKDGSEKVIFCDGDIRNFRLEQTFELVISMFAVMSYMITNEDLIAAFRTVRHHLKPGGIFVFDSWFGPGVFHDPPTFRQKELMDKGKRVIRTATPIFDPVEQVVDIRFDVVEMLGDNKNRAVTEHHLMRPLFVQEVKHLAGLNGMELLTVFPWMEFNRKLTLNDWLAGFVLRAQ